MALIDPKDAENIYNESGWAARRGEAREWRDAFTAKEILEAVDELPDDLGEEQPKYPIGVSLVQIFAETHRDVLFGIPPSTDVSPVSILLASDDDRHKALCDEYQKVIARVLYQSKAASLFMRAGLMMQVLGGWAFRVTVVTGDCASATYVAHSADDLAHIYSQFHADCRKIVYAPKPAEKEKKEDTPSVAAVALAALDEKKTITVERWKFYTAVTTGVIAVLVALVALIK